MAAGHAATAREIVKVAGITIASVGRPSAVSDGLAVAGARPGSSSSPPMSVTI
ncbi:hypothetical protein HMPREF9566_01656 [Cutibacterium acnes HL045PA1]|nr:hypothetical protein HMPREF9609_02326 [Cutibacterium acnes HL027PA1]EFT06392.1 hypothetical protein HMPREF9618_02534 [Cutibacterium acnes HL082PA1]EFT20562.1 hypothetical protein HMPREF9566_01656 [Cutibacterium acnes HL045PA1]EFT27512.1 hypothetical protein HMPREF9594_02574 [Cutibacterium acnes HL005PA1]EGE89611.1 hypothetical protein HMPREF9570_02462 [Cutibacterium acnes HL043PA1]EGF02042.1 hypothetical protein HMPREF9586_01424 [Cutibacterium acnes HL083PA2]